MTTRSKTQKTTPSPPTRTLQPTAPLTTTPQSTTPAPATTPPATAPPPATTPSPATTPPAATTPPLRKTAPGKKTPRKSTSKRLKCDNPNCTQPIRKGQEAAALKCKQKGCKRLCHKIKCSNISRYEKNPVWYCIHHNPDPTPLSSLFRRPAYSDKCTVNCAGCKKYIKTNDPRIICGGCEKPFHKKCTGIVGRTAQDQYVNSPKSWSCQNCSAPSTIDTEEMVLRPEVAETKSGYFKEQLKIMQWNANAISTKLVELSSNLHNADIDICLIQESKLEKGNPDPVVKGYVTMRADRRNKGGGLVALVKDSIKCEKLARNEKNGTEVASLRVKMKKKEWVQLTNVYCRPANSAGEDVVMETELIPTAANSIICGDFNCHNELWDPFQPADSRGDELLDWTLDKELSILNDGKNHTRNNPGSGGESVPDITCCGSAWRGKAEWRVGESIGSSDHLPIIITINTKVNHQETVGAIARWKRNGVDWKLFQKETEEEFKACPVLKKTRERVERFVSILAGVAKRVVGRTKPGKQTKCWMSPVVKSKIQIRNRLRRTVKENRSEWIDACRAVNEAIETAKEESWRDLLEDVITDADEGKLWGIIKSLNGSTSTNAPNVAMIHNGKTITCNRKKSDIFMQHYARVSKLKFDKSDRDLNRTLKKLLRTPSVDEDSCRDFTMRELDKAISVMRGKGAAGPDDIPPTFLKALGPCGKEELLSIFNQSFRNAECPQSWRNATIIPLLKSEKPASELASYRPVSLTSCLVKLIERMIGDRIYHMAETRNWLHPSQAGFRKGMSCEDQITRTIQRINDGFHTFPPQRSVLVLLDFSKAYDTVWRQKLLLTLAEKGMPLTYIRWLRAFLDNRQARVRFNNTMGGSRTLHQGLPQGSVLAPLLFICYINTLAEIIPTKNLNSLFADDVGILATNRDRDAAVADAQEAVDVVSGWSKEWKLNLNAAKSETSFFSNWTQETKWQPSIMIDGQPIKYTAFPRLLGVVLDCQLTFTKHTENVSKAAGSSCRTLAALGHTTWGWRKQHLNKVYHSIIKSRLDYAGPAWQANLADCNRLSLDRAQNKALRLISGQFKDSPLPALRFETGIPSYQTHMDRNILKSREKALRLPEEHPRRVAREESVIKRLDRHTWCSKADEIAGKLDIKDLSPRKPLSFHTLAPWQNKPLDNIYSQVPGLSGRSDSEARKIELSYKRIRELAADYTIYSDGSASAGVRDGGAGVVITFGDPGDPTVVDTLTKKGSKITCSFNEEATAMDMALDWIEDHCSGSTRVAICTDSQSLCEALVGFGHEISSLRMKLLSAKADISIQWIPGHSNIAGNELADAAAKLATKLDTDPTEITFKSVCAYAKAAITDDTTTHTRSARVYASYSKKKEEEIKSRADQVLLARIRSGHHWCLESYHKLVDKEHDARCKECGEELHDLEHWFCSCVANSHIRQRMFGSPVVELDLLTSDPVAAIAFTRAALGLNKSQ